MSGESEGEGFWHDGEDAKKYDGAVKKHCICEKRFVITVLDDTLKWDVELCLTGVRLRDLRGASRTHPPPAPRAPHQTSPDKIDAEQSPPSIG